MPLLNRIKRNSGSTIYQNVVVKCGPHELINKQAELMQAAPLCHVPVLFKGEGFYVMPEAQDLPSDCSWEIPSAINLLKNMWRVYSGFTSTSHLRNPLQRQAYYNKIRLRAIEDAVPERLVRELHHWSDKIMRPNSVQWGAFVHGDATLENILVLKHGSTRDVRLIDTSPSPIPPEPEVDIGKLLQSYYGYEDRFTSSTIDALEQQLHLLGVSDLSKFYFITHLIRLWKYQPQRQDWVMEIIKDGDYYKDF